MPLTTEGVIEELQRFRTDKMALCALIGSMGAESEADALTRLREIRDTAAEQLTAIRRTRKAQRTKNQHDLEPIWQGVHDLAQEIEPWLTHLVERPPATPPDDATKPDEASRSVAAGKGARA